MRIAGRRSRFRATMGVPLFDGIGTTILFKITTVSDAACGAIVEPCRSGKFCSDGNTTSPSDPRLVNSPKAATNLYKHRPLTVGKIRNSASFSVGVWFCLCFTSKGSSLAAGASKKSPNRQ